MTDCRWTGIVRSEVLRQFDLCRTRDGVRVVVLQADLLDRLVTRLVAPLIARDAVEASIRHLNPVLRLADGDFVLMPHLAAAVRVSELGPVDGSLALYGDEIVRAVDTLLTGV